MNEHINGIAVLVATITQFIVGAIWYTPLFGRVWGKIHGFEKHSQEEQTEMRRQMMPLLVMQFLMVGLNAFVLAYIVAALPSQSPYLLAGLMWVGFALPTQVSAVLFGGTEPRWIVKKIAIMAGGAFVCYMAAAAIISWLQ